MQLTIQGPPCPFGLRNSTLQTGSICYLHFQACDNISHKITIAFR